MGRLGGMSMFNCSKCGFHGCSSRNLEKSLDECPSKNEKVQSKAMELYKNEENLMIANNAALVEAEGYCKQTRLEETINFMKKCGYKKIGMAFCVGLQKEARDVQNILEYHGFQVSSVLCKNGAYPKSDIGISQDQTIRNCKDEVMCNPIGQALLLNEEHTDFNIILGLCVGHDTLAIKYMDAPVTVFAVKDRVTGHNPLAAVYLSQGYYHDKLY